jgi:hypothetical protein
VIDNPRERFARVKTVAVQVLEPLRRSRKLTLQRAPATRSDQIGLHQLTVLHQAVNHA